MLTSCEDSDSVVLSKDEYNKLLDNSGPKYPKMFELSGWDKLDGKRNSIQVIKCNDEHDYMVINHGCSSETITHYVDCELCLTRKQQEREELNRLIINVKDSIQCVK